jgi:hypothetical protein
MSDRAASMAAVFSGVTELDDLLHVPNGDRRQKPRAATRALLELHGSKHRRRWRPVSLTLGGA